MNTGIRDSCWEKLEELKILPLHSQYIFYLLLFVVKNKVLFKSNPDIHWLFTRYKTNLHPPLLHLQKSQKNVYLTEIEIFTYLLQNIKDLSHDVKDLKKSIKKISPSGFILHTWRIFFLRSIIDLGTIYKF